ncbi:hypothetical protein C4587_03020, partial [Candidatus Parcubacteria bacterium]
VLAVLAARNLLTRAEVADFFPTACLGTWKNVTNAQGEPETLNAADTEITEANSAVYEGGLSQIFCGAFVPPDYEPKGNITHVGLTLVWRVGERPPAGAAGTPEISPEARPSSAPSLPAPAPPLKEQEPEVPSSDVPSSQPTEEKETPAAEEGIIAEPQPDGGAATEEAPSSTPAVLPPPDPESSGTSTSAFPRRDVSLLGRIIAVAFAQEEATSSSEMPDPLPPADPEENSLTEPPPEEAVQLPSEQAEEPSASSSAETEATTTIIAPPISVELAPIEEAPAPTSSPPLVGETSSTPGEVIAPSVVSPPEPDEHFLKVSYSTDAETWIELARVSPVYWEKFTVQLPVKSWDEVKKLQIAIEAVPTNLNPVPRVYLDGMFLETHYEIPPLLQGQEGEADPKGPDGEVPIIVLPRDQSPIVGASTTETFGAGESPAFDFDLDALPGAPASTSVSSTPASTSTEPAPLPAQEPPSAKNREILSLVDFFLGLFDVRRSARAQTGPAPPLLPTEDNPVVAEIIGPDKKPTNIQPVFLAVQNQLRVSVPEPKTNLRPGKYALRLWIFKNGVVYHTENEFTWGVLVLNTTKSIYTLHDPVRMGFGVLDDEGKTLCDADIATAITAPSGKVLHFSTQGGTIQLSPECGPITVTNAPDYWLDTTADETGTYRVSVKAQTKNGEREINDSFGVQDPPDFDVERVGPTRIFPPERYGMTVRIRANQAYQGAIVETIPASFVVAPEGGVQTATRGGEQTISWTVNLAPGATIELAYSFDAPDISPELYKLGPLKIGAWQETRKWQIAADIVTSDGRLFYGDTNNAGTIKFNTRDNSDNWGSEVSSTITPTSSNINWLIAKHASTRDEVFIATMHNSGALGMTKCTGLCDASGDFTGDTGDNFLIPSITGGSSMTCNGTLGACEKRFDLAYEQLSGDALVAFATSTAGRVLYCEFDGASWSGSNCATPSQLNIGSSTAAFEWVRLVPQGGEQISMGRTNRILLVAQDANDDIFAAIWDGSAWGNVETMTTGSSSGPTQNFDGAWEVSGSERALVVFGAGTASSTDQARYRTWSSTSSQWSASTSVGVFGESSFNDWIEMESDPRSDRICLATQGAGNEVRAWIWRATTTDAFANIAGDTAGAEGRVNVAVGCAWQKQTANVSSSAVFLWTDVGSSDVSDYVNWIEGVTTGPTDMPGASSNDAMQFGEAGVRGAPHKNDFVVVEENINCDLESNYRNPATSGWNRSDYLITPAGSSSGADNIPPDCSANLGTESHGYYFIFLPHLDWSRNWRFYTDETSDTPTAGAAGENVRPTSTVANGDFVRLRIQTVELGNVQELNVRKKLQWVASTTCPDPDSCANTNWTDVGETGDSGAVWRYATAAETCASCSDDTVLATTTLTGSTAVGYYVSSASGASSLDSTVLSITEIDYPLRAQNATSGEIYFFRMYGTPGADGENTPIFRRQDTGTTDCLGAACAYPSVRMASAGNSAPLVSSVVLNHGSAITLNPNTTTTVEVNFTVTDTDGCADVFTSGGATTTVFRSGVGSSCSLSNLNCYEIATSTHNCSGGSSANATATLKLYYFAQATDASSSFSGEDWVAHVAVRDAGGLTASATSSHRELNTLVAVDVTTSSISYGTLSPNANTGSTNQAVTVKNAGNASTSLELSGTALTSGPNSIATSSQHYATSSFTFGGSEQALSETAASVSGFLLAGTLLTEWKYTTALPSSFDSHGAAGYNGFVYTIGGGPSSTVRFAQAVGDGTLGAWSNTSPLPGAIQHQGVEVYNGYLYSIGGTPQGGGATTTVNFAQINATGSVEAWANTIPLPSALSQPGSAVYNDFLYIVGGNDGSNVTSTVRFAQLNTTGSIGSWTSTTPLPSALDSIRGSTFAENGYLYVAGGGDGSFATSTVLRASINATGSVNAWTATTALPSSTLRSFAFADGGLVYSLLGADRTGAATSSVLFAPLEDSGSVGQWGGLSSEPSAVGLAVAALHNGYLYRLGGAGTTSVAYAPISTRNTYWGIEIPAGSATGTHSGTNTFTAVFSP